MDIIKIVKASVFNVIRTVPLAQDQEVVTLNVTLLA